jgi:hypothetical protein
MGLFGPSKIKITPNNFVNTQLDKLFSDNFIDAEKKSFVNLSKEMSILQSVPVDKYVKERQRVFYNLFRLAWDRTTPHSVFIEYSFVFVMLADPRVEAIDSGLYGMGISRAQKAGMDTFEFISRLFIGQIIPSDAHISDADYSQLCEIYKTDFSRLYKSFQALIKQHKFINRTSENQEASSRQ